MPKIHIVKTLLITLLTALSATLAAAAPPEKPDPWAPVRFLAGEWEGTAEGQAGSGTVRRSYAFILRDRYLHEKNTSTYPPQEKNRNGEVHEHWSLISYDGKRAVLVMRQFHQEGFVNQYVLQKDAANAGRLVFDSEAFENFSNTWKARETYEILSNDEFIETFAMAAPGKPFETYGKNHFKRIIRK